MWAGEVGHDRVDMVPGAVTSGSASPGDSPLTLVPKQMRTRWEAQLDTGYGAAVSVTDEMEREQRKGVEKESAPWHSWG